MDGLIEAFTDPGLQEERVVVRIAGATAIGHGSVQELPCHVEVQQPRAPRPAEPHDAERYEIEAAAELQRPLAGTEFGGRLLRRNDAGEQQKQERERVERSHDTPPQQWWDNLRLEVQRRDE